MTGGNVVILGEVGDNFAAGMTGGMAFIYDKENEFNKRVNSDTVIWQRLETEYWKKFLEKLINKHYQETSSIKSKKIIDDFKNEILHFYQVCPKEMLKKLEKPISEKKIIGIAS